MSGQSEKKSQPMSGSAAVDSTAKKSAGDGASAHTDSKTGSSASLKAPAIAIEQLAEALEERQTPDKRQSERPIEFDDRRQVKRRASDLS